MTIKTQVNTLLDKKMDRQEFLKHLALGLVAISGASAILRLMSSKQDITTATFTGQTIGQSYGSSAYGGTDSRNFL